MTTPSLAVVLDRLARYTLFGPLAEGRRVLDIGGLDGRGLALLAEAGATEITALAATPTALTAQLAAAGVEGVEVLAEDTFPLPFEDASFDLVVCHDLPERMAATPDFVGELRRVLDRDGYLALAVANPEGRWLSQLFGERPAASASYREIYERLAPSFGTMSAYGQSPLAASLFYDTASEDEDPGLVFDRSLLADDEQPGWFVLLFGPEPWRRDELSIVQLPFGELEQTAASPTASAASVADATAEIEVEVDAEGMAAAQARIAELEEQLELQRSQAEEQARGYETEMAVWRERLEAAEIRANAVALQLEARSRARDEALARLQEVETQLARARHDGESLESQIRDLLEEGVHLRRIIETLETRLADGEPSTTGAPVADEPEAVVATASPLLGETGDQVGEPVPNVPDTAGAAAAALDHGEGTKVPDLDAAIAAELAGAPVALSPSRDIPGDSAPAPVADEPRDEDLHDGSLTAETPDRFLSSAPPGEDTAGATTEAPAPPYESFSLDEGVTAPDPLASTIEPSGSEERAPMSLDDLLGDAPSPASPTDLDTSSPSAPFAAPGPDALSDTEQGTFAGGVAFERKNVQESPVPAPTSAGTADSEAVFGELEVELPAEPTRTKSDARPRSPTTLDDLEDLLANSIPPARNR